MKKLLNTLYVLSENTFLSLDGENVVVKTDEKETRLPFCIIEEIVCFNYQGCSPRLMGKCAENNVSLSFVSPNGRFLAKIVGETKGNVFTRTAQIKTFEDNNARLNLIRNSIGAKFCNMKFFVSRSIRDYPDINHDGSVTKLIDDINFYSKQLYEEEDVDILRGIEGNISHIYFNLFDKFFRVDGFVFNGRSKRPPLDEINSVLSLLYTMQSNNIGSALEVAGIDPYIGFFHTLRSGRQSLALDIIEEFRAIIDRFVVTVFNLKQFSKEDFDYQLGGTVFLNDVGRKKLIKLWQDKKKETIFHPYLGEKIPFGLLPFIQASLFGKFLRKEIEEYPPYLVK
ncbi:MAG TPA: CRISPR-associated endonuclease Cas1 [Clostridia bacterium]|nr:CRISPR-associated endonuclease Cas1 [Clostridia bacterium]